MFKTREEWLTQAVEEVRPLFDLAGKPLPKAIRIGCGNHSNAKRSKLLGETFLSTASADKSVEIFISPEIAKPLVVFEILIHELCHATTNSGDTHGKDFEHIAREMHLIPIGTGRQPYKYTNESPDFRSAYEDIINSLGAYPHAELVVDRSTKKQSTRLIKATCPTCNYPVYLTRVWASKGLPNCYCGDTFSI